MSTQQLEKHDQLRILDEHAEYLTALTAIDVLLVKLLSADWADAPLLIQQMRMAMPDSIIATRKVVDES